MCLLMLSVMSYIPKRLKIITFSPNKDVVIKIKKYGFLLTSSVLTIRYYLCTELHQQFYIFMSRLQRCCRNSSKGNGND